jgi:hypothetical protein
MSNLTNCFNWLNVIGHFDQGGQVFVQFDHMSKLRNNQTSYFNHIDWSKDTHVIQAPTLSLHQNVS